MTLPVPVGYEPLVAIQACPPGGVYAELIIYYLDFINDVYQMYTFIANQDYLFALVIAIYVGASTLRYLYVPHHEALESVRRGRPTRAWRRILSAEAQIEAPGTGLVAPYAFCLTANMTPLTLCSALYGLYSSSKHIGFGRMHWELWGWVMEFRAVRKSSSWTPMLIWYFLASMSELCTFAIVSRTFHPLFTLLCYVLAAGINAMSVAMRHSCKHAMDCFLQSLRYPSCVFFGCHTNTWSVAIESALQNQTFVVAPYLGPGLPAALFVMLRLYLWVVFCFALSLPHGICSWHLTIARPMGWPVLHDEFILPLESMARVVQSCVLEEDCNGEENGLNPACIWKGLLLALAALTLPVRFIGTLLYVISWFDYEEELDLAQQLIQKSDEAESWAEEQAKLHKDKDCLELLFLVRTPDVEDSEQDLCGLLSMQSDVTEISSDSRSDGPKP
ncbi:Pentatricopeptide repeat-containing protein [Durusdinium trenchii]|uniref:Chloroplastic n=1 Tax=Durusdinium trenchii TaxID=1381693 RepID=A0ABP0LQS5_9DINO